MNNNIIFFSLCVVILCVMVTFYYMNVVNNIYSDLTYIKNEINKITYSNT